LPKSINIHLDTREVLSYAVVQLSRNASMLFILYGKKPKGELSHRSAALFQVVIVPSRVLLIMASSEDWTMAANCARTCSACLRSVISTKPWIAPRISPRLFFNGRSAGL
jgi:hypothetical protein